MADKAHRLTDEIIEQMEEHLSAVYSDALKDVQKKADEYFSKFEEADKKKRILMEKGKLSEDEYKRWRKNKILYSKRFTELKEEISKQLLNVNQTALAYINGEIPEVYSLNYNALASDLEDIKGYSFTLTDAQTVKNLAQADESLLPYKEIDPAKDIPWNMKKINSEVLQGIVQGESVSDIAKRIKHVEEMNKVAAIRSARTIVTGAENKGRQDSYEKAASDGIIMKREWLATFDYRTRHVHALLDGQIAEVNEPFHSELGDIMFPGDPSAHPSNVYNCRCTMRAKVVGIGKTVIKTEQQRNKPNVAEWLEGERKKDPKTFDKEQKKVYNKSEDKKQYTEYRARLGSDMPKGGFFAFQDLKYSDDKAYSDLKAFYRYKGRVPEARKKDFEIAQRIKDLGIVGTVRVPAAKIDVSNISAVNDHAFRHGCTVEDAKKYIKNAKVSIVRNRWDGLSQNFYSTDGAVYIDYTTLKIKTMYEKKEFDPKTQSMMEVFE